MKHQLIRQLEDALALLDEGGQDLDLAWLHARQLARRATAPQVRERLEVLVGRIEHVQATVAQARSLVVAARGSRRDWLPASSPLADREPSRRDE